MSRELKWRDPVSVSLSEWARRGQLDPLIGRRELADQLLATVCRRNGNNALLVGESGVGKTALISGLVNTITAGREHGPLSGTEVWQIPHVALWTASVNTLLDPAADPVLLVVEDLDLLLVEDRPGSGYAAATLNAICHGPRPVVATVSPGGYADLATISGQFQRIDVPPTDAAETVAILTGLRGLYQEHHGVTITDEAIAAAPVLAADYLPQRRFPGAAVGLIDTAGARLKVAGGAGPAVVDERFLAEVARGLADGQRDVGGRDIR